MTIDSFTQIIDIPSIGQRFAIAQIKVALVHIIRNFRIKLSPNNKPIVIDPQTLLSYPKDGILLRMEARWNLCTCTLYTWQIVWYVPLYAHQARFILIKLLFSKFTESQNIRQWFVVKVSIEINEAVIISMTRVYIKCTWGTINCNLAPGQCFIQQQSKCRAISI